jgi:hypothetical protein
VTPFLTPVFGGSTFAKPPFFLDEFGWRDTPKKRNKE